MDPRNLEHRKANFKGKTAFSAQEVSPISLSLMFVEIVSVPTFGCNNRNLGNDLHLRTRAHFYTQLRRRREEQQVEIRKQKVG